MNELTKEINLYTTISRAPTQGAHILENLPVVKKIPAAAECELVGTSRVFVVGAGPSLDDDIEHLRDVDGFVLATNTSLPAFKSRDMHVDGAIAIESMDIDHCYDGVGRWFLDLRANPAWFARAEEKGRWFVPAHTEFARLSCILGVPPVRGVGSALVSAVGLAIEWGADEIVLVGVDMAVESDGAMYSPTSGWPTARAVPTEEGDRYTVQGQDDRRELHERHNLPHERGGELIPVRGINGNFVMTTPNLDAQREYLKAEAGIFGERVHMRNGTSRGAECAGWDPVSMDGFERRNVVDMSDGEPMSSSKFRTAIEKLRDIAAEHLIMSRAVTDLKTPGPFVMSSAVTIPPIAYTIASSVCARLTHSFDPCNPTKKYSTPEKIHGLYEAYCEADQMVIDRCEELLDAAPDLMAGLEGCNDGQMV